MISSVSASDISTTLDPSAFATLGSDINIICLSDEANPTAIIEWSLNGALPETSEVTEHACCNAKKRRSKITIPNVQRSNNGQQITCSIPGRSVSRMITLSVACKSFPRIMSYQSEKKYSLHTFLSHFKENVIQPEKKHHQLVIISMLQYNAKVVT